MTAPLDQAVTLTPTGLRLAVRAKPGQAKARPLKIVDIGDDKWALEVSVAAEAQDGKANKALIERLSRELGLPRQAVMLKTGDTGRLKLFDVAGDGPALKRLLAEKIS